MSWPKFLLPSREFDISQFVYADCTPEQSASPVPPTHQLVQFAEQVLGVPVHPRSLVLSHADLRNLEARMEAFIEAYVPPEATTKFAVPLRVYFAELWTAEARPRVSRYLTPGTASYLLAEDIT